MNTLIMSIKKMPVTVLLAWLFLSALFAALFVADPVVAMVVGLAAGFVVALKRLFDYYVLGE